MTLPRQAVRRVRACFVLGLLLATACGQASVTTTAASASEECDLEQAKEVVGYDDADRLSPEGEKAICAKASILLEQEAKDEESQKNPGEPVPPPEPSPLYYEEGIYGEEEAGEHRPSDYYYVNLWRGVVDDQNIAVFAGAEIADPSHGVILLQVGDPDTGKHEDSVLDAPIPGPLRVSGAKNPDVEIVSDSTGEHVTFDTRQRQWEGL